MSTLNEQLKHLSVQEKQRLREKLMNQLRPNHIVRDTTSLSHAQQRLWVLQQLHSCDYLYNVPVVVALPSTLDLAVLQEAFNRVLRDNPILLSEIRFDEERVTQYQKTCNILLEEMTLLSDLPDVFEVTSASPLASFFLQAFDLENAPLFRMKVLKTPHQRFLLGCFHHLMIDGWSVNLFISKLQEQYTRIEMKKEPETKLMQDYFAYIAWEKTQGETEGLLLYWRERLRHKPLVVDLATDYPRKLEKSNSGKTIYRKISSSTLTWMDKYTDFSLNQVILFAFQFMLARYSGQNEITVGMPISGRMHERWQETIGLFVNTMIHPTHIEYTKTVEEQLCVLKETLFNDLAHSEIPFDVLVKCLYEEKLIHQTALFNVLYNFIATEQMGGGAKKTWPMRYCTLPVSKFDLSLHVYAAESNVDLFLEFNTDLFDVRTVEHMLRYLLVVLEILPEYVEKNLRQLSLACFNRTQQECQNES